SPPPCSTSATRARRSVVRARIASALAANSGERVSMSDRSRVMWAASASRRLAEQLAADQHAADFAGACADLVQLGIAQQPTRGVVVDIPVAPQRLDRLERHPGCLLRRVKDRPRRILARR